MRTASIINTLGGSITYGGKMVLQSSCGACARAIGGGPHDRRRFTSQVASAKQQQQSGQNPQQRGSRRTTSCNHPVTHAAPRANG